MNYMLNFSKCLPAASTTTTRRKREGERTSSCSNGFYDIFLPDSDFVSDPPIRGHVRPKRATQEGEPSPTLDSLGSTPASVEAEYKENNWLANIFFLLIY
jgi:hypothetical protein